MQRLLALQNNIKINAVTSLFYNELRSIPHAQCTCMGNLNSPRCQSMSATARMMSTVTFNSLPTNWVFVYISLLKITRKNVHDRRKLRSESVNPKFFKNGYVMVSGKLQKLDRSLFHRNVWRQNKPYIRGEDFWEQSVSCRWAVRRLGVPVT